MERIHTYDLKQIPRHAESVEREVEFKYGLYNCLQHKIEKTKINSTCLVIGYSYESPKTYIVLENAPVGADTGASSIKLHYVPKDLIERDFELVDRPSVGILRYPEKGDRVFCLAKERYQGVSGGKEYKVHSMAMDRVDVHNSDYTYEPQYFAVITGMPGRSSWPGTKITVTAFNSDIGSSQFKISTDKTDAIDSMTYSIAACADFVNKSSFREFAEDDEIRRVEMLKEDRLLERRRPSKKEKKREVYTPEVIVRKVIN